jgi:hypothetical protein
MVAFMVGVATLAGAGRSRRASSPGRLGLARRIARAVALCLLLAAVAGCNGAPLPPSALGEAGGPALEPERYFEGRTRSFGVFEDPFGNPTGRFAVDGTGRREADGTLVLEQRVRLEDGETFLRHWRLRPLGGGRYEASGPALRGPAEGEARGRLFRLSYVEELPPGGWLRTLRFRHWMALSEDGRTLVNRFMVSKLGLPVARATELFGRLP